MKREEAIATIESLFPADSIFEVTRSIGRELLRKAKDDSGDWRDESTGVLVRYAELCIEKHQQD